MEMDEALKIVRQFFRTYRRLPTYQELADLCGFSSKNASYKLVDKLIAQGYLYRDDKGHLSPRSLAIPLHTLTTLQQDSKHSDEFSIGTIPLEDYLVTRPEDSYALQVTDDSLEAVHIKQKDIVIADRVRRPKKGDIVISHKRKWTIKQFKEGEKVDAVVVSVVRRFHEV